MAAPVSTLVLVLLAALAPATRCVAATATAAPARSPMRAIAIAEDQRRWADGELRRYLAHRDPAVRARAVLAVGRLQDSTSAPALLPLLADPAVAVRREAAFALGQIGRREARAGLEHALQDRDSVVVDLALEAIGKLGDHASTTVVTAFLGSPSARLREDAAVALWRIADTTAAGALVAHLADADPDVRWRMAYALEKLPLPARVVPAVIPLLSDPVALVRAHAARTLGREKSALATHALVGALQDKDAAVLVQALRALVLVADTTDGAQIHAMSPLVEHGDPYVRVTAVTALAERFAWVTCAFRDSQDTGHRLMNGMDDTDPATRGACGRAIVLHFGHEGLNVASRLEHDHSPYTRAGWMDGMRTIADPDWTERRLEAGLDRSQPLIVRMTAADLAGTLGHRKPDGALRPLLDTLRAGVLDRDVLFAASCAGALGDWGDTASVPMLAHAYATRGRDADADARIGIRDALRALAPKAYADSVEAANPLPKPPTSYAADFQDPPKEKRVVMHFKSGDIEWELLGREAPQTVRNFVKLARRGYFDGLFIHRVVPDFVIQDGDPTGTGSGGPGWTIRCEYNRERYEAGMVGMALSGKDTGGSQYFITLSPQPHLDGRYTIFARVTKGLDLARRVQQGATVLKVDILP
jgi:cyclophilin family peptidyl-prolyl cis-trans isomerase/HEAT repeat protein